MQKPTEFRRTLFETSAGGSKITKTDTGQHRNQNPSKMHFEAEKIGVPGFVAEFFLLLE